MIEEEAQEEPKRQAVTESLEELEAKEAEQAALLGSSWESQRAHETKLQESKQEHEKSMAATKAKAAKRKAIMDVWDQPSVLAKYT